VLGFVCATALGVELLPGQLQLLALIHDGVLQPVSDGFVDWQPVPPTIMPIPTTPKIVRRQSVTRIASDPSLVPAILRRKFSFATAACRNWQRRR